MNILNEMKQWFSNKPKPQPERHFFNTIHATGQTLIDFEAGNKKGDAIVYSLFLLNPNAEMTPREIWAMSLSQGYDYELTSVRRSITNLTKSGKLEKLSKQKKESKGTNNYLWKLRAA